ncbi:MAG: adenylyl cyclase class-3/4/guanylyl cyclase [Solirubrobacterales bacterium]|nr:adenylyl cyclase class-3/4/guanylyl cyclase [Solirubrobacterales bacterium]
MQCGAVMAPRCQACGEPMPHGARFCMACGAQADIPGAPPDGAAARAAAEEPAAAASPTLDERRTVTVVFADLSGYTSVAEQLDPEALKRQLQRILGRLGEEVVKYGGHVDKFIGDNVMAIFGAPVAHGDDPERAVRAGLGMQAAMEELNRPLAAQHGATFKLCVGINTGEVLAGPVGDGYTVIGDTVNVAARLQSAARPGSVTVGEATYRATREAVDFAPLEEPLLLKGKAEPVRAWEALAAHLPAPAAASPTRAFVGRASEISQLHDLLGRVERRRGPHLATVIGDPGVGKSRLLRQYEQELEDRDVRPVIRHGRCLPYGSNIAYWPLAEVIRAECGIIDGDPPVAAWRKLSSRLGELLDGPGSDSRSTAPKTAVIGRLLGIEGPDEPVPSEQQDALQVREVFFAAIRSCVEGLARDGPVILVWEDIHWADEGMLDLIDHLLQWVRAPVLQLCLAREELLERRPEWGGVRRNSTTAFLEPLDESDTRELIALLMRAEKLDDDVIAAVAARAEGNPLFAEEMVRRLAEEDGASAAELPATVQALLAARLDSLEPFQRRVLAHASVVGRTFWEAALTPVAEAEGEDLGEALRVLRGKDIIVTGEGRAVAGEPELAFKHALIRDAAYEMLPKAVRAQKHFEVGRFIETRAGDRVDEVVALLAQHYGKAADLGRELGLGNGELASYRDKALKYLEAAGDAATALYSNAEAFSSYEAAIGEAGEGAEAVARLLEKQGDVALRLGRVDVAVGVWERALEHHSAHEDLEHVAELHRKIGAGLAHKGERKQAIEHHQRGINLIKDGEPSLTLVRLYEEAAWMYMQTGDNMLAIYASEKALRLAELLGEVRAASRAHGIFGRVFGRIGDTAKARENLERAVELARGSDAHETVLALMALGTHLESSDGDYAAAAGAYGEALALAQQVGDVPAEIELHAAGAQLALYAADWQEVERSSDASAELSEREGLIGKLCLPYAIRGRLHWRGGRWQESESAYRLAFELAEQIGWSEVCFDALFGLSSTLRDQGELDGAAKVLLQALEVCDRAGLIVQAIQANSAQAVLQRMTGQNDEAGQAAQRAVELSERVPYPVGAAAAIEASGIVGTAPEALADLTRARESWQALTRPLEAAWCQLLLGQRLLEDDPTAGAKSLEQAASEYDGLGVTHLALRARELAGKHSSNR